MIAESGAAQHLIEADGITVRRGGRVVVRGVALSVGGGELLCLVGPNGAGKSTLLAALAGSIFVESGHVALLGDPIAGLSALEQARRRAVLPQEHVVSGSFSCAEVVRMARHPWNRTPANADDEAVVADAMTRCDVTGFADRPFSTLSGGERGRVALARVLAQDTPVLLLDEPTAAMDPRFGETVMSLVARRVADGAAAIAVVHDLGMAAAYADTVAVLDGGAIVAAGPPAETLTDELLSDTYGLPMTSVVVDGRQVIVPRRDHRR